MSLCIEHPDADLLARQLAAYTGEPLGQAVVHALREQLRRERKRRPHQPTALRDELLEIGQQCAKLPVLDPRTPDDILGYDSHGVPGGW